MLFPLINSVIVPTIGRVGHRNWGGGGGGGGGCSEKLKLMFWAPQSTKAGFELRSDCHKQTDRDEAEGNHFHHFDSPQPRLCPFVLRLLVV